MILQLLALGRIHSHSINFLEVLVKLCTNIQDLFQQRIPYRLLERNSKCLRRSCRILNFPANPRVSSRRRKTQQHNGWKDCGKRRAFFFSFLVSLGGLLPSVQFLGCKFINFILRNNCRLLLTFTFIDAIHHRPGLKNATPCQPKEILPHLPSCRLI